MTTHNDMTKYHEWLSITIANVDRELSSCNSIDLDDYTSGSGRSHNSGLTVIRRRFLLSLLELQDCDVREIRSQQVPELI
jgi:hypothetical protein